MLLSMPLWSQEYVPPVIALLIHVFLLRSGDSIKDVHPHATVLAEGAEKLFWLDVISSTVRRPLAMQRRGMGASGSDALRSQAITSDMACTPCGRCSDAG